MSDNKFKFCILVSHPIQYFSPVYRRVSEINCIDLTVIYSSRAGLDDAYDPGFGKKLSWDIPLLDGYSSVFLSDESRPSLIDWRILNILRNLRPDVILTHGYSRATNILAMIFARLTGTKVLVRGDTRISNRHGSKSKRLLKKLILKLVDGCVYIGTLNRNYYRSLGVPDERLHYSPFCVDNDFFSKSNIFRIESRINLAKALGIDEDSVLICTCSKLISSKKVIDSIMAFERIANDFPKACFIIAGSGPEELQLKNYVENKSIPRVFFVGFLNQSNLPGFYAACDVFMFSSRDEAWGLALNEAMASGLPAIVSNDVGAAPDLVIHGETGFVHEVGDVDQISKFLSILLSSKELRYEMGVKSKNHIMNWSVDACVSGIEQSIIKVLE